MKNKINRKKTIYTILDALRYKILDEARMTTKGKRRQLTRMTRLRLWLRRASRKEGYGFRIQSGMTDRMKRVLSVLVTLVLIVQVVLPGGLFKFAVDQAHAAITITVVLPDPTSDWDIGDSNLIRWTTDVTFPDLPPAYFKLYYSENSGSSWVSPAIDDYEAYTGSPQTYNWEIPVVNGAGESDFQVKVEGYDSGDALVASDASDDFTIDYGPADSFVVDLPSETAVNLYTTMTITAKDQYGNTIINYSFDSMTLNNSGSPAWTTNGTVVPSPNTVNGGGSTVYSNVTWNSGVTTAFNPITFGTVGTGGVSVTAPALGSDVITIIADAVYIDAPTSASSFIIGSSGNSITFRAGGETTIDHLDLDYAPDGSTWTSITTDLAPATMPQTYSWTIPDGTPGATWKVRVKSYDVSDALIATGTSYAFTVSYGDLASFTVEAPVSATVNKFFSLTVTAKDTYGNTITTFSSATAIGATPGTISPVTIGNGGDTGTWSNGVVTYDSFAITAPGQQIITATYSGATGQDTMVITGGGSSITGCYYKDITAPASNVVGILDANNNIIPMPATTYKGPITVVVEAQDPYMDISADGCPLGVGVDTAELHLRRGANAWESKGNGTYFMPGGGKRNGYDYYKWTLDIPDSTYQVWYFYSIAVDYDDNTEEAPGTPGYDALTIINTVGPYLSASNPIHQQTNVAINAPIILTFSQPMDRISTQAALKITRVDGLAVPDLRLTYSWANSDKTLTIGHTTTFLYNINYKVTIDPTIATNKNGIYLITSDPNANPNPFTFTTALAPVPNQPYLATSSKVVNMLVASPGATPLYTIVLRNTGTANANVVFRDPIPTNTVYDNLVTNATYDAATNAIVWSGRINRNGTRTITFRVKINSPLANGLEIVNTAYINDGVNPEIQKYAITVIAAIPSSKVIGIIDRNGVFIPVSLPATPINVYFSPLTVVAEVQNDASVASTDLWYRTSATGSVWTNYGAGVKLKDNLDGSAQYKWDMNISNQNLTYYFYTRASDGAGNVEGLPPTPGYDMQIYAYTIQPYITAIYPVANAQNVGITAYIQTSFSQIMNTTSVQNAISVTKADGTPLPPELIFAYTWYNNNRTVRLTHLVPFDYITQYKVVIDPAVAVSANGVPINITNPLAKPNEWLFTTAKQQVPNITTSVKNVNKDQTDPGDILLYTVVVDNEKGGVSATVTVTDPIPVNTTYANYASGGFVYQPINNRMYWRGTVPAGLKQTMQFQVKINSPLDNGTVITNIATMKDQTNPAIDRITTTLIGSAPDWIQSTRTVVVDNVERPNGPALPGDTLIYTVTAWNTGNMDANNVIITDTLPANAAFDPTSADPNGFVYDPVTNTLQWSGDILAKKLVGLSYKVVLDTNPKLFAPPNNQAFSQTTIDDGLMEYVMNNIMMIDVPEDPTEPPIGGRKPRTNQAPYITDQIQPGSNAKSVKLYSKIVVPFSEPMDTASVVYETYIGLRKIDTSKWLAEWDSDVAVLTLTPDKPLESGETYSINIPEGNDTEGLALIIDGPVPNNTWSFTTVRPALYFSSPEGPVSLLIGTVRGPITITLADWINFTTKDDQPRQYAPYAVEKDNLILNLETTSATGRFGAANGGEFYTKEWGPWYNKPSGGPYLTIPVGQSNAQFYYTESVVGYASMTAADLSQGYAIVDTPGKPVIASTNELVDDQIYFESDPQSIPVGDVSNPIIFGVMSREDNVWLEAGRAFLLSSSSSTGSFYTSDKRPIDKTVTMPTNLGSQTFYVHYIPSERLTETIYYQDSLPGTYMLTVADAGELGISAVGDLNIAAVYSDRVAKSAGQNITILPLETQELDEIIDELIEIEDDTGRKLARVEINPDDIVILPGGVKVFGAKAYDTLGKEIKEVRFSWYIIAGGGTIMRHGLAEDNHQSRFSAGRIAGVYRDTVLVATYYNHDIMTDLATVRVARTITYGAPGTLPSTGLNGIQWVFMVLTLLAAVALAAVEHYEKTYLAQSHK